MNKIVVVDLSLQDNSTVHILRAGYAICGFSNKLPRDWEDGHLWVAYPEEINNVNCQGGLDKWRAFDTAAQS